MGISRAIISLFALALISSAIANETPPPSTNQTLSTAIQEMQKANYFAFVMLLNLIPSDKMPSNITFLMPNNRVLAKAVIPENDVLDFLLRHSIPSPLRFDHLNHFPTGSIIPSSETDFTLRVSNNGRRSFFLNNVKLVSPDICVAGSSVRCHGIDEVLRLVDPPNTPMTTSAAPPPAGPDVDLAPAATPQPAASSPSPKKSGSSHLASRLTLCFFWLLPLSTLHI